MWDHELPEWHVTLHATLLVPVRNCAWCRTTTSRLPNKLRRGLNDAVVIWTLCNEEATSGSVKQSRKRRKHSEHGVVQKCQ
eukprot:2209310-Amphidinium_carterae.1